MVEITEQLPVKVVNRVLGGNGNVRVVLAEHPIRQELASCVPVVDYAEVFTYDKEAIRKLIERTSWLKKHSTTVIMTAVDGKYRAHQVIFEESMLGIFMKLQPRRCKDPEIAGRINDLQEELILILRDVLKGNVPKRGFCNEEEGLLPRPGLSMHAVPKLCRQASNGCRFSARALKFFYDMPIEDIAEGIFEQKADGTETAPLIAEYLEVMVEAGGLPKLTIQEDSIYGSTVDMYKAFEEISRRKNLPKFFRSSYHLAAIIRRERDALEELGWRKVYVTAVNGQRFYRYEKDQ